MSKDSSAVNVNIGCAPLLVVFTVLLVLKLAGVVEWSWWIITAPLWVWPAIPLVFLAFMACVAVAVVLIVTPFIIWDEWR